MRAAGSAWVFGGVLACFVAVSAVSSGSSGPQLGALDRHGIGAALRMARVEAVACIGQACADGLAYEIGEWIHLSFPGVAVTGWEFRPEKSPLVAAEATSKYLAWLPEILAPRAIVTGLSRILVIGDAVSSSEVVCKTLEALHWSSKAVARRVVFLSLSSPSDASIRFTNALNKCGGGLSTSLRRMASYKVAERWGLVDAKILVLSALNSTDIDPSSTEVRQWQLAESQYSVEVRGMAPLGALELLSSVAHPGVIEHEAALGPPIAMLAQPHPRLPDCFLQGGGWEGDAVHACAASLQAYISSQAKGHCVDTSCSDVIKSNNRPDHHPWLDAAIELQPSHRRRLPSTPWSVPVPQLTDDAELPAAVQEMARDGRTWLRRRHPMGKMGRVTSNWMVAVGVSRLSRLQSVMTQEQCDRTRLLAVRPAPLGTAVSAIAVGLAKALAIGATLNRTLIVLPALRSNKHAPADSSSCESSMGWQCWFEPLSTCTSPSSTLTLEPVPWSAIRPHNSEPGSGHDPSSLLASDVDDDRIVLYDAWQSDESRTLLERRWVEYAVSAESINTLIDEVHSSHHVTNDEQDAAWWTALVAYVWQPLPWVMSHPAVQAWSELTRHSWRRVHHQLSEDAEALNGASAPQARAYTVAAFIGDPMLSDLTDEARASAAIESAMSQFSQTRQSIHVGLLALSKDDRSIAAVVAGAAWAHDVSVFAVQPAPAPAQTDIAHVTMAAMADQVLGNTSWPEVQVGNALAGMFETHS